MDQDQDRDLTIEEKLAIVGTYAALVHAINAGTPR